MGKIAIGADYMGYDFKTQLLEKFSENDIEFIDYGTDSNVTPDDFTDYAELIAKSITNEEADYGVLICDSGVGVSIAANRFKKIRAALVHNINQAIHSREHDDANVICFASEYSSVDEAFEMFQAFIEADFDALERRVSRLKKLEQLGD